MSKTAPASIFADTPLIEIEGLKTWFPLNEGVLQSLLGRGGSRYMKAVDGVSFSLRRGDILGLAGESGCGKTTLGMTILRLYDPSFGAIRFDGKDISKLDHKALGSFRREMQIVFQDPFQSLNPRFTVLETVKEPLDIHRIGTEESKIESVVRALERAELTPPEDYLEAYPHQLSGGQRQRVVIARAVVMEPKFIVADEPVSMLDVSIRASILNLFRKFADNMGMAILYISHDLSTIRYICDTVGIMYLSRIVEMGTAEEVVHHPLHPYSQALLSSVPIPDPFHKRRALEIPGEVMSTADFSGGCRFRPRCPKAMDICTRTEPELVDRGKSRLVACHAV